jgi:hypothetical protein
MTSEPGLTRDHPVESCEAKLRNFRAFTVAHPHLVAAKEQLMTTLLDSAPNSLVFVLGPTGVGKTTLRAKIEKELTVGLTKQLENDYERLPVVSVEAVAPESGNFSWREHFKRLLDAMREPAIDYKLSRKGKPWGLGRPVFPFDPSARGAGAEYQHSVELALRYRRPAAVFIDEAQHLSKMNSGRRLLDQLDVIKSLANRSGIPHVLLGTYDLLAFRNLNGQLSRRSTDVHFGRYRAERANEAAIFLNVVRSFEAQLPVDKAIDLTKDWEYLYERSIGCVGVLKEWLVRALSRALRRGQKGLERVDLETCALSVSQCDKMLTECIEGEMRMTENSESRCRLRARLGLKPPVERSVPPQVVPQAGASRRWRNRRPGQRSPTRDVVGNVGFGHAS